MKKQFKTIYDHAVVVSPNGGESLTDQQYLTECDINHILRQYKITGVLPNSMRVGVGGDFSDIGDFQSCLEKISRAKSEFESLPSDLRARFGNDPASYVDFVLNPSNVEECVKLGLRVLPPEKEETPTDVLKRIEKVVTPKGDGAA